MQVEHHDLPHEFPEFKQTIHDLKISSTHFARLLDEYESLTRQIEGLDRHCEHWPPGNCGAGFRPSHPA